MAMSLRVKYQSIVTTLKQKITFPEKYKGTIIEKWARYWEGLINDYTDVAKDTIKDARAKPWKTLAYATAAGLFSYSWSVNPSDIDFRDQVIEYHNSFALVGTSVRNPISEAHLRKIEKSYNNKTIRRFSFGIFSIVWLDDFDDKLGLYKAQCDYLKPKLLSFNQRIIDIGFWGQYWLLKQKMVDYDVNPNEWISPNDKNYEYNTTVKKSLLQ